MSLTVPAAAPHVNVARQDAGARRVRLHAWIRDPLFHFVLLGGALFFVDHLLAPKADDRRAIVITADVDRDAKELFRARRGRDPDAKEQEALRRVWLDNEVLYREGLALQLDRGDDAIRERVIFKALSVIDANVTPPTRDDVKLRAWFEANRTRYDEPVRYDFEEAVLYGDSSEPALRDFAEALNKGTPGDAKAGLRVFRGRPHDNLVDAYGADFARALEASAPGQWRVFATSTGPRIMRLATVTPGKPANFDALRNVVGQDWIDAEMAERRSAAVRALAAKYSVRVEGAP